MSNSEADQIMEVEQKQTESGDDVLSCSSSILNTSQEADKDDDAFDSDDDGINVTILTKPPTVTPLLRQDQSGTKLTEETMKPLSGAGKKRFKRLVENGMNPDEARRLAHVPLLTPSMNSTNRFPNYESNSSGENPRPKKQGRRLNKNLPLTKKSVQDRIDQIRPGSSGQSKSTEGRVKPSYRDVLTAVKIGILPKGYPNSELTMPQLIATQKAVLNKVVQQRKERVKPKFGNCLFRPGYLILICKNQDTSNWIKNTISNITPWVGAELIAVDEDKIPQPLSLIGFFPMSAEDSNEDILALLEAQNENLVVDSWKIFMRKIINNRHVELTFSVDGISMKTLEECKFVLDYKFGTAPIRKKAPKYAEFERMEVDQNREDASGFTKTCETGGNVEKNTTTVNAPGPSSVQNTERTPSKVQKANRTTDTGERTGDTNVGENTTNKYVTGQTGVQSTGRTPKKPDYRKINTSAGKNQSTNDCNSSTGERTNVPNDQSFNRHIQ